MKKKTDEVEHDGETFDLQTLMQHSSKIDQNIAEAEHEQGRQEAMESYGLVEAGAKAAKSTKVDTKQIDKLNETIEDLREQLAATEETNKNLVQANEDFQQALEARDVQIQTLTEELDKVSTREKPSAPTIPNAPKPSAPVDGSEPNPWSEG